MRFIPMAGVVLRKKPGVKGRYVAAPRAWTSAGTRSVANMAVFIAMRAHKKKGSEGSGVRGGNRKN
jgi:hypothetical protein